MKRDRRLQVLSAEHHRALVLARRIDRAFERGEAGPALVAEVGARFEADLVPHFRVEEEGLLPALLGAGHAHLCDRTLREHATLREHLAAAEGDLERLRAFAGLLAEHVRFEERELFPVWEGLHGAALGGLGAWRGPASGSRPPGSRGTHRS